MTSLFPSDSLIYLTNQEWKRSDYLIETIQELKPKMDQFNRELQSLLHPDKFLINNSFIIIDSTILEKDSDSSIVSRVAKLENSYIHNYDSSDIFVFYKYLRNGNYYKILITKYVIEIRIDNSIELNSQIKDFVWLALETVSGIDKMLAPDLLKFTSGDLIKQINSNETLLINRNDIYDKSWAVVIGIDKYHNLPNLDYAVNDAISVKEMLVEKFNYKNENVKLLLNTEANKNNIEKIISDISLNAGENDRILVFYAGHGETMILPDGGEMGYLVPIDGNQKNLFASAIAMDDLKDLSYISKAKHMLFLVDACYGGLAAVGSRGLESAKVPNYIEKISKIKSRQIITAGGKDEKVFEKSEWGHSAYTKNLLRGLQDGFADANGDGYITADELGDYLSEKVSIDSENQQTPQSRRLTSHEGEYIFFNVNQFETDNVKNKKNTIAYKLIIHKYDSNFMNPKEFPPIISTSVYNMINSLPPDIVKEPNIMDASLSSIDLDDWNRLIETLSQIESASIGDSITTFWNENYYFKVFAQ